MSAFDDALTRLATKYNGNGYDPSTNPGGLDNGGHTVNFIPALQDIATAGGGVSSLSSAAATSAATATTKASEASASAGQAVTAKTAAEAASDAAAASATALVDVFRLSVSAEVSITGATTLTSTAFGKMHVCTGTTADYTVGLPAAAGNAGKLLGIRIGTYCTKLVTLDGNASEVIDGATARVMWAGESAILLCDGVGWTKIAGKSIPMVCRMSATAVQSISSGTGTKARVDIKDVDNASIGDVATSTITIKRSGFYICVAGASIAADITWQMGFFGASTRATTSGLISPLSAHAVVLSGSVAYLSILQTSGSAVNTSTYPYPYISVQEVVQW